MTESVALGIPTGSKTGFIGAPGIPRDFQKSEVQLRRGLLGLFSVTQQTQQNWPPHAISPLFAISELLTFLKVWVIVLETSKQQQQQGNWERMFPPLTLMPA